MKLDKVISVLKEHKEHWKRLKKEHIAPKEVLQRENNSRGKCGILCADEIAGSGILKG